MLRFAFLLCLAVLPVAVCAGQEPNTAVLKIHLPPRAELEIDGVKQTETGEWRTFRSSALKPGTSTTHALRARWREADSTVTIERNVRVSSGETVTVELRPADDLSAEERAILELVNKERQKTGASPLKPHSLLVRIAHEHSANMARQNNLSHTLDGKTMTDRIQAVGYRFQEAGENIGLGARTPAEVVQLWMTSPFHRENILNARFEEVGVGLGRSTQGERYYTLVFARPWQH